MGREEDAALAREETLPRNAPMSGMPEAFGMCSQLVGDGACDSVLVAVGDGPRCGRLSVAESSGSVSIGARAMRVRACRRGGGGEERKDRDDGPGPDPDSKSRGEGRAENDLNEVAKRRGIGMGGESVLEWCGVLGSAPAFDCAVRDLKREYSVLWFGSGSRRGTDASAEIARLWTSRRLWTVVEVPSLDVELLVCLGWRFEARRRANGTRTRIRATMKRTPPMEATMMIARLFWLDGWDAVDDPVVC